MEQLPKTKAEAMLAGQKKYFTGKRCKNGHLSSRFVSNGQCCSCDKERINSRYHTNEKYNKRRTNHDKIRKNQISKLWRENNKDKVKYLRQKREMYKQHTIPIWYDEFNEFYNKECIHLAFIRKELTGVEWHIDHMYPLRNKVVCGLHCADNLQVIPADLNLWKRNKLLLTQRNEWLAFL